MGKNIILLLDDDISITSMGREFSRALKPAKAIRFTPNCFSELSAEDFEHLTIIGHANTQIWGNTDRYDPQSFVSAFDNALTKANIPRTAIKRVRAIGCELGLILDDQTSYAQTLVNQFALQGYDLKLSAFSVKQQDFKGLAQLVVGFDIKNTSVFIWGYDAVNKELKFNQLQNTINKKTEQLNTLKQNMSLFDRITPWETSLIKTINRLEREIKLLRLKQTGLLRIAYMHENFIHALDYIPQYQFSAQFTQNEYLAFQTQLNTMKKQYQTSLTTIEQLNHDDQVYYPDGTSITKKEYTSYWDQYFAEQEKKLRIMQQHLPQPEAQTIPTSAPSEQGLTIKRWFWWPRKMKTIPEDMQPVTKILTFLSDNELLDESTYRDLAHNKGTIADQEAIVHVLSQMKEAGISIQAHRKAIMNLEVASLNKITSALKQWNTLPRVQLDENLFRYLRDNIQHLSAPPTLLGDCLNALKSIEGHMHLLPDWFDQNRLARLIKLDENTLTSIKTILEELSMNDALDKKTFDYILSHTRELPEKQSAITESFKRMSTMLNIPLEENKRPIMSLQKIHVEKINKILELLDTEPSVDLDYDSYNLLQNKISTLKGTPENLARCLKAMIKHHIAPTQLIGQDKLSRLMSMTTEELEGTATILESLSKHKALHENMFNYLLDNLSTLHHQAQKISDNLTQLAAQEDTMGSWKALTKKGSQGRKQAFAQLCHAPNPTASPDTQSPRRNLSNS